MIKCSRQSTPSLPDVANAAKGMSHTCFDAQVYAVVAQCKFLDLTPSLHAHKRIASKIRGPLPE
jgi:hypothetical protein